MNNVPFRPFEIVNPASKAGRDTLDEMAEEIRSLRKMTESLVRVVQQVWQSFPSVQTVRPRSFLARIDGYAPISANRWRYDWVEVEQVDGQTPGTYAWHDGLRASGAHPEAKAWNGWEYANDGIGYEGGIDVSYEAYGDKTCVTILALPIGILTDMFEIDVPGDLDHPHYWCCHPNPISVQCDCDEPDPPGDPNGDGGYGGPPPPVPPDYGTKNPTTVFGATSPGAPSSGGGNTAAD